MEKMRRRDVDEMTVSHRSRDENPSYAFLCFAMALMNPVGVLNQKMDVVADINPTKLAWNLKVRIVRLYEFPSKWNPREIYSMELVLQDERGDRIHCSIPKSNMARRFLFNPFQFISYEKIKAMVGVNKNYLLDCMGHVVGREDVTLLVTKSGEERRCTLFGDLVDEALGLFDKDDGHPIILVAQLFKPNFYLNESQPINSISDELHGGSLPITTIEEVLDKTNETSCWILATVVSIEIGGSDWYYALCKSCPRKVKENKGCYLRKHCGKVGINTPLRYHLHVIAADGTGCIGLIIWNQEAKLVVGKSASEDSGSESIFECGLETPSKGVVADSNAGATIGGVYSLDVQGSTTKPLKGRAGKRKLE
ncbi:replication protein A 70 kDa DNA-binding subunit A-like isoform [Arachis hypogaea]|uniref:Replication protein A 70 kDa DNA-binding subunit A-like isoform n=1 Tax=Arachis hypogaea TaxID=3818 RepID=A0A6B9V6G9_ARAHY|nr:replication protein A 70 kDa DNA-binding subunit A-like isoform [Arachis hypogaea]